MTRINDKRVAAATPEEQEEPVKLRISPLRAPYAKEDMLVQEPGETELDDTDRVALGAPRFRREERVVTVLSAEREVVPWYKQLFIGPRCECLDKKEDADSPVEEAYCPQCFMTGVIGGYKRYKQAVRLFGVYIEWGGIDPPFPQGRLEARLDFEYNVTPGDFFELGKVVADVGFNVDAGVGERHSNEGKSCLWRIEDVVVERDDSGEFPMCWRVSCRNVELYEAIYGWFVTKGVALDG